MPSRDRKLGSSAGGGSAPAAAAAQRGAAYAQPFGATDRRDAWWLQPLSQALGLMVLGAYATWAAIQGNHFDFTGGGARYLSPFYSPLVQPKWWPFSPAFLILAIPGGFRATCYYYRKAYYRAFFADPLACAVGERTGAGYRGEAKFPLILQNAHRFFVVLAVVFLYFLWSDVVHAFTFNGAFGIGVGSLVILASTTLLTLYTASCHTVRHIIGGNLDCFSCALAGGPRFRAWTAVGGLNGHHMGLAWWSLLGVCSADFYVRFCSLGVLHDLRLL